ncbi:DMT family transporter [Bacillus albus]|uniref:DMT family transporter n=1 Tax=Bacillus cereus group TaxID=86661 RepID=UPI001419806F|nr:MULTISPECIES: DMT family transporter [Bacillus cereus group]MBU5215319.1 DMT family transporter [Bacillus albus]MDA2028373.1 DMT family transporter [Bacillus cereus group sp. Bcc03]MDA2218677.1 DMT family transporter [Bacillus cereus group sp. Bc228]MDA2230075.1 DMT family transporter [Bacillus cereus group sp. Bc227]MDA2263008.1 DMT family transporter [Bacillus cereus group sp. Bc200]
MKGIVFDVFAGVFITLQGTFNAKLSSHIGIWSTSIITHLIGFIIATTIFLFKKEEKVTDLKRVKKIYLAAGAFGVLIICAETLAIYSLGVTLTAGTLMVAQLLTATFIEMKGLFQMKKIQMERYHIVGTIVMIIGIVVFNM